MQGCRIIMPKRPLRALIAFSLVSVCFGSLGCPTPPPPMPTFPDADLYYTTFNSVRMIDTTGNEHTVYAPNGADFFGLDLEGTAVFVADNTFSFLGFTPIFQDLTANDQWDACSPQTTTCDAATDIELIPGLDDAVACADEAVVYVNIPSAMVFGGGTRASVITQADDVALPFSVSVNALRYAFVVGVDEMSVTDLNDPAFNTAPVNGHGITLGGFSVFDPEGNFYVCDPGADEIRMYTAAQISSITSSLTSGSPINETMTVLSAGGMLAGSMGADANVRGPVGIDFRDGMLWVTVDVGTGMPGHIVQVDPSDGAQTMWRTGLEGPRDIHMN